MLSLPHLAVLFIVALIVFGPEKLPGLARTMGKAMAEFRKVTFDLRRVVEDEMREMDRATPRGGDSEKRCRRAAEFAGRPAQRLRRARRICRMPPHSRGVGEPASGGETPTAAAQPAENDPVPRSRPLGPLRAALRMPRRAKPQHELRLRRRSGSRAFHPCPLPIILSLPPTGAAEEPVGRMSFFEHLAELRTRLIHAARRL